VRHFQIAGNPLQPLLPLQIGNYFGGTRLIAVPNGKNAKDWAIRSQASKVPMNYEEGSETRC
jgi:hypothetical protein